MNSTNIHSSSDFETAHCHPLMSILIVIVIFLGVNRPQRIIASLTNNITVLSVQPRLLPMASTDGNIFGVEVVGHPGIFLHLFNAYLKKKYMFCSQKHIT